jgi:hypothetical protein
MYRGGEWTDPSDHVELRDTSRQIQCQPEFITKLGFDIGARQETEETDWLCIRGGRHLEHESDRVLHWHEFPPHASRNAEDLFFRLMKELCKVVYLLSSATIKNV